MKLAFHSKVLITGIEGFTGVHLSRYLSSEGFDVVGLKSDLTNRNSVIEEVLSVKPDYVIHLAGISYSAEENVGLIYDVNVVGSTNLLDALALLKTTVKKVLLASSASVYGNVPNSILSEDICPRPVSHYGCSKLAMELISQGYNDKLPLLVTRPFNYTGIGHANHFLIPKIVRAYQNREEKIELGNLRVDREFNDVRDVCVIYRDLLLSENNASTVNICSGKTISLMSVIELMDSIADYRIEVKVNKAFVRENEIKSLSGDVSRLNKLIDLSFAYSIEDTLDWMYRSSND